jgi:aryl-alcohol dehydrogenase-like predicted oxidoreductase
MNKNFRMGKLGYGASKLGKYLSHYSLSKKSFIHNLFKNYLPVIDTSPSYSFGFSERYINFLIKFYKKDDIKFF